MNENHDDQEFFSAAETQLKRTDYAPPQPFANGLYWGRGEHTTPDEAIRQAVQSMHEQVYADLCTKNQGCWADYSAPSHTMTLVGKGQDVVFLATAMAHINFWRYGATQPPSGNA